MRARLALVGALACCASVGASAQNDISARDELRCAYWAALVASEAPDAETQNAFSMALTYFLGRLEATTGGDIEESFDKGLLIEVTEDFDRTATACRSRMVEFGKRMMVFGDEMTRVGEEMQASELESEGVTAAGN